jgi:hypothetical protein
VIDRSWAEVFARDWVDAWNAHDLERVLAHYADDFEMTSPLIVERMGVTSGSLRGKGAIRLYWGQGLAASPQLHFELLNVMVGVQAIAIVYRSMTANRLVIERIEFDERGRAVRGEALHGPPGVGVEGGDSSGIRC